MSGYESWGRVPASTPARVERLAPEAEALPDPAGLPVLAYGRGRSYGDACLNNGGLLLDTAALDRVLDFDAEHGVVRCEAGVTLAELLARTVPEGWFLPVTPGTKYVTVGGAVAHDVHGKNHHRDGTVGRFVRRLELWRSDGQRLVCSPEVHADLFQATVGGLGLTGLIRWVELQFLPVTSDRIALRRTRFDSLDDFFRINAEANARSRYTVAWVDTTATGQRLGRGLYMEGDHAPGAADGSDLPAPHPPAEPRVRVPFDAPGGLLNRLTVRAFNGLYWRQQRRPVVEKRVHYEPFFYPLDAVGDWNRLYGRRGFFQYQSVVPSEHGPEATRAMLERIARSGEASFLAVLKTFGDVPSPGLLSFPMPGITLALDFPNRGARTRRLFRDLDRLVREAGGRLYPAKDACMSADDFRAFYPQWEAFREHVDPAFSSSFWRRVTEG
ncbi:MAG: FAD-binding oxidoreductase [Rhodothermales bacterium]|nr:FAD-binding oxidoreductase [Rhodothermales bacterium]